MRTSMAVITRFGFILVMHKNKRTFTNNKKIK